MICILNSQNEWLSARSLFDFLHPEDIEKVREQLSTQEPQNSGRILDLKTGTVKKEGHQGEFFYMVYHSSVTRLNFHGVACKNLFQHRCDSVWDLDEASFVV